MTYSVCYEDFENEEEEYLTYSDEMTRVLEAGSVVLVLELYMAASYSFFEKDEVVLSDDEYKRLCDYLVENWKSLPTMYQLAVNKDDLEAHTCNLSVCPDGVKPKVGVNYPPSIENIIESIDERVLTAGSHSVCSG